MTDPIVAVDRVTKRFRGTRALDGLTLSIDRSVVFGLLGPTGAGKTTLIRVLATLLRPDGGSARIAGLDVVRDAARVRQRTRGGRGRTPGQGRWTAQVLTGWSQEGVPWSPAQRYAVTGDPTRPDHTFVLRLREDAPEVLVLPPAGATSVRATHRGTPVGEAAVTDGAARLSVPAGVPFDAVEALDAAGTVVGRGTPAPTLSTSYTGVIDRWWED